MAMTIAVNQRFKTYEGPIQQIETQIQTQLDRTDNWFIKQMGSVASGQGFVVWVLWEQQIRPI